MLHKHLPRVLRLELANIPRIPQFTGNAQVLAAAHKRIRATALRRGGDAVRREVVLFTAGNRDESIIQALVLILDSGRIRLDSPAVTNKRVLPRHRLRRHDTFTPRRQTPSTRPERSVQDPPVLDLRQIEDSVRLDLHFLGVCFGQEDVRHFLGKRGSGKTVERPRPVDFVFRGVFELPGLVGESALGEVICCWAVGG